ncbi:MAG: DUF5106 domain-containing protein [Bacteroidales bacterium]|nr:DUF5106 domain-containing protein [Bacteroidales bacterium]
MNLAKSALIIICSTAILISCKGKREAAPVSEKGILKMIEVPSIITDPKEEALYIADHFWDNVDFNDTSYIANKQALNTHFSAYVQNLTTVPHDAALKSVTKLADSSIAGNPRMMMKIQEMFETAFYHPNSIFRNEELYIAILQRYIQSGKPEEVVRERLTNQLNLALKNRLGTKALDFSFVNADGRESSLYKISSDYLILMFYDPDCPTCKATMQSMESSPILAAAEGKLKILTIYAGVDFENWKSHVPKLSKKWINGCNKDLTIMDGSLYDMRPTPSLYMLDRSKTVLMKDAPYEAIEAFVADQVTGKAVR